MNKNLALILTTIIAGQVTLTGCGPATTPPDIVLTHTQGLHDVNFSIDGEYLVASVMQEGLAMWTTKNWKPAGTLLDDLHITEFWFTGNGDEIRIALYPRFGDNYKISVLGLSAPQSPRTYEAFGDDAIPALSADEGSLAVVIPEDRALYIRDLASNQLRFVYGPDKTEKIDMVGFSPDDRLVVTTVIKEIKDEAWFYLEVHSAEDGERVKKLQLAADATEFAFSKSGSYLAVGMAGGNLSVVRTTDWDVVFEGCIPGNTLIDNVLVEWLSDSILYAGGRSIGRLDVATGEIDPAISLPYSVSGIDISPDGKLLAAAFDAGDPNVFIWKLGDKR